MTLYVLKFPTYASISGVITNIHATDYYEVASANVHIDRVTVCSDSRDRKKSCYNTIDGQITRPIYSKDKVPVLVAIGSEGCN